MKHNKLRNIALPILCLTLAGCSVFKEKDSQPPLEGKRISVMELQKKLEPDAPTIPNTENFVLPKEWKNAFWPQSGGYPNHSMQNLSLNPDKLKKIWTADIGKGSTQRFPLTAQPIVVGEQIFTLDSDFNLRAFNTATGKEDWKKDVKSESEKDPVISGGIAFGENKLIVTNGYNEVLAIDPKTSDIIWRKTIPTPSRAAPTIINNRIFVTTLDNRLIALNETDGTTLWEYVGFTETAALVGAASPAAGRDIVVPVFSSGEITALRVENGSLAWSDNLAPIRRFEGLSSMSDIRALPVVDNGIVYAISFAGKLAAIDQRTGVRVWQRDIGGSNTPWVVGNNLYVITTDNTLIALNRENGVIRWVTSLPKYRNEKSKSNPLFWTGPLMGGSRLIMFSTDGKVIETNPATGEEIRTWETKQKTVIAPLIAAGTLYTLSENGTLTAYR